ncbi:hypothetical protein CB0940_01193 [Cercospora beticola]|uniref:Thioesterase domain-containing protein n=1 Tax=Cercospora beticola TaxID=122368 RepID=A0A2G5IBP6_CERBT|nr:hypothetical protein CB0940_01193 [Cercospora beticola]PIB01893.1 hypothetical protein CB0940_01193 [Cercospora beticola]WPA96623.1 hypothetical protein RHO25_001230 [Cercospora beticola]
MTTTLNNEQVAALIDAFVKEHVSVIREDNFDKRFYEALRVRSVTIAGPGTSATAVFECKIPTTYSNQPKDSPKKTIHGGAVTTFFDMTTSLAIIGCNFPAWHSTGASRKLEVTYLKPPVEGELVLFECEVIQIGKRLAELRGIMRREEDGAVLAICNHQKYLADKPHYVSKSMTKL